MSLPLNKAFSYTERDASNVSIEFTNALRDPEHISQTNATSVAAALRVLRKYDPGRCLRCVACEVYVEFGVETKWQPAASAA